MTDTSGGEPAVADVLTAINGLRVNGPAPVRALREDVLALGNRTRRLIDGLRGDMEQRFGLLMDAIADLRAGLEPHSRAIRDAQARSSSPPACSPPAPRSAPAGPGPDWRTDCIHVGKNGTLASGRREPAHRPGHHRDGLARIYGISPGFPGTERIMTEAFTRKPSGHRPPHAPATAADVMRPALTTIEPGGHVAAAAYLMKHAGVTALVVVDDDQAKQPAGIITEADIVQAVADGKDVNNVRIRALLTTHPTVISPATSIRDAARSMMTWHVRHLPVAGEAGLIGMLDITDVCAALRDPPQDNQPASRDRHTPGQPGSGRTHPTSGQERRCA
jgi:CBS domain-containing protein